VTVLHEGSVLAEGPFDAMQAHPKVREVYLGKVAEIGATAEGVHTVKIIHEQLPQLGIRMRILEGLHAVLFEGREVKEILGGLMNEPQMEDVEFTGR
jgi:glycerol-3-phosphate dehydrogenase